MKNLDSKHEGTLAIVAAFVVLFSAMLNPITSATISISLLFIYGIYKLLTKKGGRTKWRWEKIGG